MFKLNTIKNRPIKINGCRITFPPWMGSKEMSYDLKPLVNAVEKMMLRLKDNGMPYFIYISAPSQHGKSSLAKALESEGNNVKLLEFPCDLNEEMNSFDVTYIIDDADKFDHSLLKEKVELHYLNGGVVVVTAQDRYSIWRSIDGYHVLEIRS